MIDCMKYINKPIEKVTTGAYREMAKKLLVNYGEKYILGSEKGLLFKISKDSNKLMARKTKSVLIARKRNPDLVISTHPFSSQMVGLFEEKRRKIRIVLLAT